MSDVWFTELPTKVNQSGIGLQREIHAAWLGGIKADALDLIHLAVALGKPVA